MASPRPSSITIEDVYFKETTYVFPAAESDARDDEYQAAEQHHDTDSDKPPRKLPFVLRNLVSSNLHDDIAAKEVLCGLNLADPDLKEEQKLIAAELAEHYQWGTTFRRRNLTKANQYRIKAGLEPFPKTLKEARAARQARRAAANLAKETPEETLKFDAQEFYGDDSGNQFASSLQTKHGWYSTLRLWVWRFNRFYGRFKPPFLPDFYSLFGISYIVDFAIDLTFVLETLFAPIAPHEAKMSMLGFIASRIYVAFTEEARLLSMMNNLLWAGINISCFFISPSAAIILNMCGFGADTIIDMFKGIRETWHSAKLLFKTWLERRALENKADLTPEENYQLAKLRLIEANLRIRVAKLVFKHGTQLLGTILIFVGMALFWGFPPLAPVSNIFMTVGAGLVSGASTLHLFKKLWLSVPGWINDIKNVGHRIKEWDTARLNIIPVISCVVSPVVTPVFNYVLSPVFNYALIPFFSAPWKMGTKLAHKLFGLEAAAQQLKTICAENQKAEQQKINTPPQPTSASRNIPTFTKNNRDDHQAISSMPMPIPKAKKLNFDYQTASAPIEPHAKPHSTGKNSAASYSSTATINSAMDMPARTFASSWENLSAEKEQQPKKKQTSRSSSSYNSTCLYGSKPIPSQHSSSYPHTPVSSSAFLTPPSRFAVFKN